MTLITDLQTLTPLQNSSLTIGFFDGVHLGHQALLKQLQKTTHPSVVLTFSNHPSQIFTPQKPTGLILSLEQKIAALFSYGVDLVICLPFTKQLAQTSYQDFLKYLKEKLAFSHLILGENAVLGKNREGTPENIQTLAKDLGFSVQYMPKIQQSGQIISSASIRKLIHEGRIEEVSQYLGRPYTRPLQK